MKWRKVHDQSFLKDRQSRPFCSAESSLFCRVRVVAAQEQFEKMVQYVAQPSCIRSAWLSLGASNCKRWGLDEKTDDVLLRVGTHGRKVRFVYKEPRTGRVRRCLRDKSFRSFLTENHVQVGDIMEFEVVRYISGCPLFEVVIKHSRSVLALQPAESSRAKSSVKRGLSTAKVVHDPTVNPASAKVVHDLAVNPASAMVVHDLAVNPASAMVVHDPAVSPASAMVEHDPAVSPASDDMSCPVRNGCPRARVAFVREGTLYLHIYYKDK